MCKYLILFFIYIVTVQGSCKKRIACKESLYAFQENVQVFPDRDSVTIGDTIWFKFTSDKNFIDITSGNVINYSNAENLGTDISFVKFVGGSISDPGVIPAANFFDYYLVHGSFIPDAHLPEQNRDYRFAETNNEYLFLLGIIPKQTGIYAIGHGDAIGVRTRNNGCDKASFSLYYTNTNQHLYLYQQNRPGYIISGYESTHMYCFKVK